MDNYIVLKCRQCRTKLLESNSNPILTGHNSILNAKSFYYHSQDIDCRDTIDSLYLQEEGLPEWLISTVNEGEWKKGKVKCPSCFARLGSFDFVSGRKCNCNKHVLPPVHIIKGKVDYQVVEII